MRIVSSADARRNIRRKIPMLSMVAQAN